MNCWIRQTCWPRINNERRKKKDGRLAILFLFICGHFHLRLGFRLHRHHRGCCFRLRNFHRYCVYFRCRSLNCDHCCKYCFRCCVYRCCD